MMFKIVLLSFLCFVSSGGFSQDAQKMVMDIIPEFPEGGDAFIKRYNMNFRIPPSVSKISYQGVFQIVFTVDTLGMMILDTINFDNMNAARKRVSQAQLLQAREDIIKEVIRVFDRLPQWEPGSSNGVPVPTKFNLPFTIYFED